MAIGQRRAFVALAAVALLVAFAPTATAGLCEDGQWRGWRESLRMQAPGDAASDLYNGGLWVAALAGVSLGASPPDWPRWRENGFDDAIRGAIRLDTASGRDAAATASDWLAATSVFTPLLLDAGVRRAWMQGDCDGAYDIATDWIESLSLVLLVTEATKVIAGRERPNSDCFGGLTPCGDENSRKSFFSGHTSMAATGAGLICRNAIQRGVWGESTAARAIPCALGAGAAVATAFLRVAADEHWGTDVFVGLAVGALIGWFDLPGPADLLAMHWRGRDGRVAVRGQLLPMARPRSFGAQIALRF